MTLSPPLAFMPLDKSNSIAKANGEGIQSVTRRATIDE